MCRCVVPLFLWCTGHWHTSSNNQVFNFGIVWKIVCYYYSSTVQFNNIEIIILHLHFSGIWMQIADVYPVQDQLSCSPPSPTVMTYLSKTYPSSLAPTFSFRDVWPVQDVPPAQLHSQGLVPCPMISLASWTLNCMAHYVLAVFRYASGHP